MSARTALFALVSIGFMPVAWCVEDATRPSAEGKLQQALKEYREALSRCNKKEVPSPEDLTDLSEAAKNLATQQKQAAKLGLRLPGASIIPKSTESPRLGGKTENVFAKLKSLWLSLSQAPDEDAKPARFSYTQDFNKGGQGAEFNSAFYLRYFPSTWLGPQNETNEFAISVQAKLSSSDAKSIDSWRFRAEDH